MHQDNIKSALRGGVEGFLQLRLIDRRVAPGAIVRRSDEGQFAWNARRLRPARVALPPAQGVIHRHVNSGHTALAIALNGQVAALGIAGYVLRDSLFRDAVTGGDARNQLISVD